MRELERGDAIEVLQDWMGDNGDEPVWWPSVVREIVMMKSGDEITPVYCGESYQGNGITTFSVTQRDYGERWRFRQIRIDDSARIRMRDDLAKTFAAAQIVGLIKDVHYTRVHDVIAELGRLSYAFADAMLAARERSQ